MFLILFAFFGCSGGIDGFLQSKPDGPTPTVRLPEVQARAGIDRTDVPALATHYEVFLVTDWGELVGSVSGAGKAVVFSIHSGFYYYVYACAGVPDASGYTYLGGGAYPESIITYSEDVEITIPLKPITWDVSVDYSADSGRYTSFTVRLDLGSSHARLKSQMPQLYVESFGVDYEFGSPWSGSGPSYTAYDYFPGWGFDRLYTKPDPVEFFLEEIPLSCAGRWHIGCCGTDPVVHDLFNVPIPPEVYDPKDLSVTLFWDL